jgi:hypothetical protein
MFKVFRSLNVFISSTNFLKNCQNGVAFFVILGVSLDGPPLHPLYKIMTVPWARVPQWLVLAGELFAAWESSEAWESFAAWGQGRERAGQINKPTVLVHFPFTFDFWFHPRIRVAPGTLPRKKIGLHIHDSTYLSTKSEKHTSRSESV